jgi:EmrB/QacA subfamily drug resistance transporter
VHIEIQSGRARNGTGVVVSTVRGQKGAPLSRRRQRATLVIVCLATAMLCLDIAVVNTALPFLARDLHSGLSGVQWVVDAYTIALAALVLSAGSLADRLGRRRIFAAGMVVFTASSLACALAPDIAFLDAARAVQGVGGAAMFATSLAIVADAFPQARERAGAMAAYGASIGGSFAVGPAVGGALTSWFGWQSVFWVNVPLGLAAVGGIFACLRESRDPRARRLDWPGQVTLCAALVLLVLALLRGDGDGWGNPAIVAELAIAGFLLLLFTVIEHRVRAPMLPLGLFTRRDFTAAQVTAFAVSAGFFGLYLYLTLYLQNVLGLSPLRAGLALLPGTAVLFAVSALSAPVTVRFARGLVLSVGLLLVGGGVALMLIVGAHSSWTALLPGLVLACAGTGLVNPAQAALALSSGRPEESGLLSGAANTFRNGGTAVGVAVFGALIPSAAALGQGSPAGYVTGLHHALLVGSAVSLAGAVGVAALIGLRAPRAAVR